jgi:hypothetical protein
MVTQGDRDVERATEVATRIVAGGLLALAPPEWQLPLLSLYQQELANAPGEPVEPELRAND